MKMLKCHKEPTTQCLKLFAALVAYDFVESISCVCESEIVCLEMHITLLSTTVMFESYKTVIRKLDSYEKIFPKLSIFRS